MNRSIWCCGVRPSPYQIVRGRNYNHQPVVDIEGQECNNVTKKLDLLADSDVRGPSCKYTGVENTIKISAHGKGTCYIVHRDGEVNLHRCYLETKECFWKQRKFKCKSEKGVFRLESPDDGKVLYSLEDGKVGLTNIDAMNDNMEENDLTLLKLERVEDQKGFFIHLIAGRHSDMFLFWDFDERTSEGSIQFKKKTHCSEDKRFIFNIFNGEEETENEMCCSVS